MNEASVTEITERCNALHASSKETYGRPQPARPLHTRYTPHRRETTTSTRTASALMRACFRTIPCGSSRDGNGCPRWIADEKLSCRWDGEAILGWRSHLGEAGWLRHPTTSTAGDGCAAHARRREVLVCRGVKDAVLRDVKNSPVVGMTSSSRRQESF